MENALQRVQSTIKNITKHYLFECIKWDNNQKGARFLRAVLKITIVEENLDEWFFKIENYFAKFSLYFIFQKVVR